jgi:predicted Zn-dependent protease with MMP-like domain
MRLTERQFDDRVQRALDRIPEPFQAAMDNLVITVEKRPSKALLASMGLPPDEPLFGVFDGVPLTERSAMDPPLYPDRIVLFQEPLEAYCRSLAELEREIEITLVHEMAHYLGMDEAEIEALGYG